jgi:hypothetical protein
VSFPIGWDALPDVTPRDFTIRTVAAVLAEHAPGPQEWAATMARPQPLPAELVEEGHGIPVPRVAAMHEGKRRKRAAQRRDDDGR